MPVGKNTTRNKDMQFNYDKRLNYFRNLLLLMSIFVVFLRLTYIVNSLFA
jgi:hypothetical protein